MKAKFFHRDRCRLCFSREVDLVIALEPVPLAEKYLLPSEAYDEETYPLDVYMCKECGHVQLLDVIDSETLWDDYTYHSGQTQGIVDHFKEVAHSIIQKFRPASGSLVIDVGSNDGSLLRPFKESGFNVLGIDPAKQIAAKATASGIETLPELMTAELGGRVRAERGAASVVTAFNVFAHADDISGVTEGIRQMLAPDGIFIFEAQYLMDIVDKMLLGTIFHEHMSHHSLKPLQSFLARLGMELIDVERVNIQKGSIIGAVQLLGGPRVVQPAVHELLALEAERKLDQIETVKGFARRLQANREKLALMLEEWRRHGKKIAAYGAARSGPTFIVQFGLGSLITCIFDDHPQKVNRLSPGDRIPVVPTEELYVRRPDVVFILAWVHAKKIIAKNRKFLEEGGSFVVLCPDVQVVDKDSNAPVL